MELARSRHEVQSEIEAKALRSLVYRKEVLKDPKKILSLELDIALPEHVQVKVLEENQNTLYLVLRFPDTENLEQFTESDSKESLEDKDLEQISGGMQHFSLSTSFGIGLQEVVDENLELQ